MKVSLGDFSVKSQEPTFSPGICVLDILTKNGFTFKCYMDERDNTFKPHYLMVNDEVLAIGDYLMLKYSKLKGSDFRYGKMGLDSDVHLEPSRILTSKEFLSYLQSEHREETIKKLIK